MRRFIALGAVLVAAACTKSDSAADSAKVALAGIPDGPRTVTVDAHDFAFTIADTIPAGMTTFRLMNNGTTFHHMVVARLDSGKTIVDLTAALKNPGPPPAWMVMVGGPNAPAPKGESNATIDIAAGNYALICFVDMPGGVPHFAKGMIKPLTVTPSATPSALAPIAADSITLDDYSFKLSRPFSAGSHTFRVVSNAMQPHEVELIKLAPGKTAKDMLAWIQTPKGPPPGEAVGGTAPAVKGIPVWFTADLSAGDYLLLCFLPASDGKLHFQHGMMLAQTVQ